MTSSALKEEIEENYSTFETQWPSEQKDAVAAIASQRKKFVGSYVRISSIQAWRTSVVQDAVDDDSLAFFFEAQNDLLVSHCLARAGSFRQALKALRSAIENVYFTLYYKDHPIELRKWQLGQHKAGFQELHAYLAGHPDIQPHGTQDTGLDTLHEEYSTLSKAVHGSAKSFRMTTNLIDIQLWSKDLASVGKWETRERTVVVALNLLLVHMFHGLLTGSQRSGLREVMGLVLGADRAVKIKTALGVNIRKA